MAEVRKSHQGWYNYLARKASMEGDEALTMMEDMLLCLHHIQNHLIEQRKDTAASRLASEHVEGMVGAFDSVMNDYIAPRLGVPYPGSAEVRAAMDIARDQKRKELTGAKQK